MKIDKNMSIAELQAYVKKMCAERRFDHETVPEKFVLFVEEVGELAKGIRKLTEVKFADDTKMTEAVEEIADLQFVLINIANDLNIDIADALEAKEVKNRKRIWQ